MKKVRLIATALFLVSSLWAAAQDADNRWTLQEAIDYAWKNNIQVKQSELMVWNNELNLRQARMNRLPNLNANTSFNNNVGRSIDPFTNTVVDQDLSSQSYGLNSSVTLFNGLGQHYTVQQNKANVEKSEFDLQTQRNNTALSIANQFLNVLLAQEQLKSAQLSLETSKLQYDRTKKQVEAGSLANQNLLQADQQVASDEVNLISAENSLDLARLLLKQALQLPAATPFEIETPVIDDPTADELEDLDLEAVYQSALRLPEVKSAEAQIESSKFGILIARASYLPSLSLSGALRTSYSTAAPDQFPDPNSPTGFKENTYMNQLDFNLARGVGLTLSIPIFNRFQVRTNVGLAKLNEENAKYGYTNTKNVLRQNIEQSYYNARAAAKTFIATKRQVESLQESYRNIEHRFNLGAANSVEYNQVKNDFNRAQNDLIRSKYDFIFKQKVLDFYQGKPLTL
ncbi:MAG TPA: TolC family protein [Cyclobacteriaceae bacterium]|nr:TolC family protein [Cyclobacteriaceae bacterium]